MKNFTFVRNLNLLLPGNKIFNSKLYTIFFVLLFLSGSFTLSAQYNCVNLGEAVKYSVLGLNNTFVNLHNVTVNGGRVGVSLGGSLNFSSASSVNADIYLHTGVSYSLGGVFIGNLYTNQNLTQAVTDATNASNTANSLSATQSFSSWSSSMTINGNGGLNVIKVSNVNLSSSSIITLAGGANDCFIINVSGSFTMGGSASIETSGVPSSHVLINIHGSGTNVTSQINNKVNGTLLALNRTIIFHGIAGQVICGGAELKLMSSCTVDYVPFYQPVELGNFVWEDKNFNGIQDIGEKGVKNTIVNLYADENGDNQPDGAPLKTVITGDNGLYNFTGLAAGTYIVGIIPELNKFIGGPTTATSAFPNNNINTDNNGVTEVGNEIRSNSITLLQGTEPTDDGDGENGNLSLDFGLVKPSSVGDQIWIDKDGDGKFNHGEVGYSYVRLDILSTNGQILKTTTSDIQGKYKISNLIPGNYYMKITPPPTYSLTTKGDGTDSTDSDFDQISFYTSLFSLGYDAEKKDVDGGLIKPVQLPISLSLFNGRLNGNTATLHWVNEHEINLAYYAVERSWNAMDFVQTGSNVNAGGSVTMQKEYNFQDLILQNSFEKIYYRLRVVSLSGEITYSNVIILRSGSVKLNKLYPNPVVSDVTLELETKNRMQADLIITDLQGKLVRSTKQQLEQGGNQFTINGLGSLPSGTYQLQIKGNGETITERFIKK
jgi:hypothetical protein